MNSVDIEHLMETVKTQNPWHNPENKDWFIKDGSLRDVMEADSQGYYESPKILFYLEKEFFRPMFTNPKNWGTFVMLGPRRIGKTSTLKYMIKKLIDAGFNRRSFVYLSLDQDELLLAEIDGKRLLREFISMVIDEYKTPEKPLIIILDEVTFYLGWARAIKNLIDSGKLGPGVGLIATGSYSLDLSSAKRELAGRYGPLGEKLKGEVFFHPKRFIEVAESLLGAEFRNFVRNNFGGFAKRTGIIEYLTGFQGEEDNTRYGYQRILKSLIDKYYDDLHNLFENIYVKTGGYPRAIYEAIISQRKGQLSVSDARYSHDIYTLFVTDSKKFKLSEDVLKGILSKINLPSMRVSSDYSTLGTMRKEDMERYMQYLETAGFVSFLPNISSPADIDIKSSLVTPRGNITKLVVNDPAAFLSIYLSSRGVTTAMLNHSEKILSDNLMREHLSESIVLSHLNHIPALKISTKNIGYILLEDESKAELADGFCWYVNFKDELILIAVEVKHVDKEVDIQEIGNNARQLKENFNVRRLIVVTNQKQFEVKDDYVIIPIEIFISLM